MQQIPKTMLAATLFGPGDLRTITKPVPQPGPGEVLIRVEACAICATDLLILDHRLPGQPPFDGTFTPGHEYSGTIVSLGKGVDEFRVGDRAAVEVHKGCGRCENCIRGLYTACLNYGNLTKGHRANGLTVDGGFAQYVVAHINTVYRLPDHISFAEATLITTAGTVLYGIDRLGGFLAGETVAVTGPGPIGLMAVQLAKALGARVLLTGTRESRLQVGREVGADVTINVNETNPVDEVRQLTGGKGADVVLECSGAANAAQEAVEMVKKGGKILLAGFFKDPVTVDLSRLISNNLVIYGARGEGGRNVGRALALMAQGRLQAKPLITHYFPLPEINRAIKTFAQRLEGAIKVIVEPQKGGKLEDGSQSGD